MTDQVSTSANPATTEVSTDTTNESHTGTEVAQGQDDKEPWRKVKHRYKAAGGDVEVDYDELIKRAQKADGADKRFQEAAQKEKDAKTRFEKLKDPNSEDFDELIELIGYEKAKKFADRLVWDQIQWDELPEHEKKRLQAEKRAQKSESELEQIKSKAAQQEVEQNRITAMSIIQKELDTVIALGQKDGIAVANLPKDEIEEMICDEMANYLEWMESEEKAGRTIKTPPPSHEDVLRKIQERYDQRSDVYVKRLSVDQLQKLLTKEQLEGLRQAEIDQLYASTPAPRGTKQTQEIDPFERRQSPKKQDRRMRTEDYFKKLEQSFGG